MSKEIDKEIEAKVDEHRARIFKNIENACHYDKESSKLFVTNAVLLDEVARLWGVLDVYSSAKHQRAKDE